MQIYLTFFDKINKLLASSDYETKYKLGLDICKKLYPDYSAFASKNNFGNAALLKKAIDFCEESLLNKIQDNTLVNDYIEKIDSITPDTEDFSSWEVSYALNASASVYELLLFTKDSKDQHLSDICSLLIDTTDFKIAAANEHISDDDIFKHPLMLETMNEITAKLK